MKAAIRSMALVAVALLLTLFQPQFASAVDARYFDASDRVSEGSDLTYFDLAIQFAPGLAWKPADGAELSKLPHLDASEEPTAIADPSIANVKRVDIELNDEPAALLMFDLGNADGSAANVNILALFDMSAKPRLLDAMDVGLDRETSFLEPGYMPLSKKFGMAFIRNSHHNAGEEYLQTSLIGIWDNKLHGVDTVFSMTWYTGKDSIEVRPSFAPVKNAVAVDATFAVKTMHCSDVCETDVDYPSATQRLTGRYSWDAAAGKFIRPDNAFDKIPLPNMEE